jgi:hypothetical protein
MRGLDPRIHLLEKVDCRIKSGNDDIGYCNRMRRKWPNRAAQS